MSVPIDINQVNEFLRVQWALVSLAVILGAALTRHFCLRRSVHAIKDFGKEVYKEISRQYLRQSLGGWILIAVSIALIDWALSFYNQRPFFSSRKECVFIATVFFFLGTLLHLRAIHLATVAVLKDRSGADRNF